MRNWAYPSTILSLILCGGVAAAHPGDGLVVDQNGIFFFGFIQPLEGPGHRACIWKSDSTSATPVVVSTYETGNLWVSRGQDGHIYFVERGYLRFDDGEDVFESALWRLEENGGITRMLGPESGSAPFGAGVFAVDHRGAIIHSEDQSKLIRRTSDGRRILLAGGESGLRDGRGDEARFSEIKRMAWGPGRTLYVQDNDTVRRVQMDGTVTTLATGLYEPQASSPVLPGPTAFMGMAVDDDGNVYGADYRNRRVFEISASGSVSVLHECEAPWAPEGLVVHKGSLYILEATTYEAPTIKPRIRLRQTDGSFETILAP